MREKGALDGKHVERGREARPSLPSCPAPRPDARRPRNLQRGRCGASAAVYGAVAQPVRAGDSKSLGRGFESPPPHQARRVKTASLRASTPTDVDLAVWEIPGRAL